MDTGGKEMDKLRDRRYPSWHEKCRCDEVLVRREEYQFSLKISSLQVMR